MSEELTPEQLAFYRLLGTAVCRRLYQAAQQLENSSSILRATADDTSTPNGNPPSQGKVIQYPSARGESKP